MRSPLHLFRQLPPVFPINRLQYFNTLALVSYFKFSVFALSRYGYLLSLSRFQQCLALSHPLSIDVSLYQKTDYYSVSLILCLSLHLD